MSKFKHTVNYLPPPQLYIKHALLCYEICNIFAKTEFYKPPQTGQDVILHSGRSVKRHAQGLLLESRFKILTTPPPPTKGKNLKIGAPLRKFLDPPLLHVPLLGNQRYRKNPSSCYRSPSVGDHVSESDSQSPQHFSLGYP